jgi:predicted ATPase
VAERLVRGTSAVRVLATSREPLRAEGEQAYQVPCLNVPPKDIEDPDGVLRHGAVQRTNKARPPVETGVTDLKRQKRQALLPLRDGRPK